MSGFLAITGKKRLSVMSDAAAYTDDGVLVNIGSKIRDLPMKEGAFVRGVSIAIGSSFYADLPIKIFAGNEPATFDEFSARFPVHLAAWENTANAKAFWAENGGRRLYQYLIAGWSESQCRNVAYMMFGADMPPRDDYPKMRPFALLPAPAIVAEGPQIMMPKSFAAWLAAVDGRRSSYDRFDAASAGRDTFEAMRAQKVTLSKNPNGPTMHNIGGFIELALIGETGIERSIIHTWPEDKVGEKIAPLSGSATIDAATIRAALARGQSANIGRSDGREQGYLVA